MNIYLYIYDVYLTLTFGLCSAGIAPMFMWNEFDVSSGACGLAPWFAYFKAYPLPAASSRAASELCVRRELPDATLAPC